MTIKTNIPTIDSWFATKEEYLAWRTSWRTVYKAISETIRADKRDRRTATSVSARCHAQWHAALNRKKAAYLMEIRKESKLEAQRQYLKARSAAPSAMAPASN